MKKIVFCLIPMLCISLNAGEPLVDVTDEELELSKKFVKLERIQQTNLYAYVKFVKARYVLTREMVWLSDKMVDAIAVQSSMILLKESK